METFKYSLDKSSRKYICPCCDNKTFVLYIDNETGSYFSNQFGRCDREEKCKCHKAPPAGKKAYFIKFLALKSISDKAFKLTDVNGIILIVPKSQILGHEKNGCWITEWFLKSTTFQYMGNESRYFTNGLSFENIIINKEPSPSIAPSFHSLELLEKMYIQYQQIDNFTRFLLTKFTTQEVFKAMQNYFITGTNLCWNGATAFFQIDDKEQIRACKIMNYNQRTGKRIKTIEGKGLINWLHKITKELDFNLVQCLFGLHLIIEDFHKVICIVESEKTAIIMSIIFPDCLWMACGSVGNFKEEFLKPIKHRKIIAYPDKGEFNNWYKKALQLNSKGFKITVSNLVENMDCENGFDLVDYYEKCFNK